MKIFTLQSIVVFIIIVLFALIGGIFVHEGVHIIHAKYDERVEFNKISYYPNCGSGKLGKGVLCIEVKLLITDSEEIEKWYSESVEREILPNILGAIMSFLIMIKLLNFGLGKKWL